MKRPFALSIMFIIGCATGGVASQLVVPPVRAGTNPTRWEYFCAGTKPDTMAQDLNKLGSQGWELATSFVSHYDALPQSGPLTADFFGFCFKRALP